MVRVRYEFSSRRTRLISKMRRQKPKVPDLIVKLIEMSDLIIEVLDARFIAETRNIEIEKMVKNRGKKLVYVVNKSDLVEINEAREKVELLGIKPYIFVSCRFRKGAIDLRRLIQIEVSKMPKRYERAQVGIVGYPNTGKSSLINYLSGGGKAKVSSESGYTKGLQKIKLTQGVLLLDSPGVIPLKETDIRRKNFIEKHTKIGVRTYDKVKDPEFITLDFTINYPGKIEKFYGFNEGDYEDFDDFIEKLGKKRSILKKGGEVDSDKVARLILKDWQEGRIKV